MAAYDAGSEVGDEREDRLVRALTAPGTPQELAGEEAALAAFRTAVAARRPFGRARLRLAAGTGISAVTVAAVLSGGMVTAAAYTARLPDPVQRVAHHLLHHVGVPAPRSDRHVVVPAPAPHPAVSVHPVGHRHVHVVRHRVHPSASPTPSARPSARPSASATPRPSASASPSRTPTPSPSASPTRRV